MGSGTSKFLPTLSSSRISSKDDLAKKTKDMTEMSDALFQFMYYNFKPNEVFDISMNPEKYVVALSELIQNHFAIVGYTTDRSVQGEIYFRKLDDLKFESLGKDIKYGKVGGQKTNTTEVTRRQKEHINNCNTISFFFVRVFQILGAMLLVIKSGDLELPGDTLVSPYLDARTQGEDDSDERQVLGVKLPKVYYSGTATSQRGGSSATSQKGGARVNDPLGAFEFLRSTLEPGTQVGEYKKYRLNNTNIYLVIKPPSPTINKDDINRTKPKFIIDVKQQGSEQKEEVEVEIEMLEILPRDLSIAEVDSRLGSVTFRIAPKRAVPIRSNQKRADDEKNQIRIEKGGIAGSARLIWKVKINDENYDRIARAAAFTRGEKPLTESKVKYILENIFFNYVYNGNLSKQYTKFQRFDLETDENSESEAPTDKLRQGDITQPKIRETAVALNKPALTGKHCINRALQLLDPLTIMNIPNAKAYTRVCKFNVPADKADVNSLYEYQPIKALSQLYGKVDIRPEQYEKSLIVIKAFISTKSPTGVSEAREGSMSVSELQGIDVDEAKSLERALQRLQLAFKAAKGEKLDSFEDIKLQKPTGCKSVDPKLVDSHPSDPMKSKGILLENTNLINQLRDASQELLAYHVNKTIAITDFLKRLFNIKQRSNGTWEVKGINNNVLYAGFKGLDSLTDQARELLLDYYEGCEGIYQEKGLKKFNEFFKDNTPAAAEGPAAPAAPEGPAAPAAPVVAPPGPAAPLVAPPGPV